MVDIWSRAEPARRYGYPTGEQAAFDAERRRAAAENRWMAAPALAPAAVPLLAAAPGAGAAARALAQLALRGAPRIGQVQRAAEAIEDALGTPRIVRRTDESLVLRGGPDGQTQLRLDTGGHGDKPHFHLEQAPPKGPPKDLLGQHRFYFKGSR